MKGERFVGIIYIYEIYKIDWTITETGRAHARAHTYRRVLCVFTAEQFQFNRSAHNSATNSNLVGEKARKRKSWKAERQRRRTKDRRREKNATLCHQCR